MCCSFQELHVKVWYIFVLWENKILSLICPKWIFFSSIFLLFWRNCWFSYCGEIRVKVRVWSLPPGGRLLMYHSTTRGQAINVSLKPSWANLIGPHWEAEMNHPLCLLTAETWPALVSLDGSIYLIGVTKTLELYISLWHPSCLFANFQKITLTNGKRVCLCGFRTSLVTPISSVVKKWPKLYLSYHYIQGSFICSLLVPTHKIVHQPAWLYTRNIFSRAQQCNRNSQNTKQPATLDWFKERSLSNLYGLASASWDDTWE